MPNLAQIVKTWVLFCFAEKGLVVAYDRLRGTNVAGRGWPLDLQIDEATGRRDAELHGFIEFCVDLLRRLPPEGWVELTALAAAEADSGRQPQRSC